MQIFQKIVLGLIILVMAGSCSRRLPKHFKIWRLTSTDRQIRQYFKAQPVQPRVFYVRTQGWRLRGWQIGADSLPLTVFIHGAPSSMVQFREWFADSNFYQKTRLMAFDRPGYGKSGYGKAEISIARQANLLCAALDSVAAGKKAVLYGSSYGGSVATRMVMEHPEKFNALVLVSASTLPEAEKTPKIAYRLKNTPLGWVAPRWAVVAMREKFSHSAALLDIQDCWEYIDCPVWILHGRLDNLIFPENAEHTCDQLAHTEVHLLQFDSLGHNIFWRNRDTIKQCILDAHLHGQRFSKN